MPGLASRVDIGRCPIGPPYFLVLSLGQDWTGGQSYTAPASTPPSVSSSDRCTVPGKARAISRAFFLQHHDKGGHMAEHV